ncbi:MAG: tRNA (N(6)-L-threonylcarbamoyladenosine(37)-C(2))-methylthiotransferase MtaB [Deltaproteobacteria bacterium]|nr:tRNA (N(6)-L-threonylcarbamoyladenosine(37)-C(2))-methylthiotransferase MtaB [Deltaproteobacteria bacterium]
MAKTFSIRTLGCKLNQYESDQIAQTFINAGWNIRSFGEEVDLVIVNTCTVTEKSDKRSRNYIRQGARFSKSRGVVVTGCLVNRDRQAVEKLPEVISAFAVQEHEDLTAIAFQPGQIERPKVLSVKCFRTRRFLKIQDGCDGSCSYCIIPKVRGEPRSRGLSQILLQAQRLVDEGCPEIVLTGITIGKYRDGDTDLAALAESIANFRGEFRLRITSIEPLHVNDRLIEVYAHEKLCSHIHLPLQSGSDRILRAMQRPYRIADYQRVLEKIRARYPKIAVGTDIIVGFPGERESDFIESLRRLEEFRFAYVHQFSFSKREGTVASNMADEVSAPSMAERVDRLREVALRTGWEYRRQFIGARLSCVVNPDRKGKSYRAVSDNYIRMNLVDSRLNQAACGKIAEVKILKTDAKQTTGAVLAPDYRSTKKPLR